MKTLMRMRQCVPCALALKRCFWTSKIIPDLFWPIKKIIHIPPYSVHHTKESDSTVCITPQSQTAHRRVKLHTKSLLVSGCFLTLIHVAKCPKGLSCFKKQSAKYFLMWKKFKNLGTPRKLYKDYFHFNNNLLKMLFSICVSTFCEPIQKSEN